MFEYKQRPWTRDISDAEYNAAVGRAPAEVSHPEEIDMHRWADDGGPVPPCDVCHVTGGHYGMCPHAEARP